MSGLSRRSLLGYSGSAAAGAVLTTNATTQEATAVSAETATGADTDSRPSAAADFPDGTRFSGTVRMPGTEMTELTIGFSVGTTEAPAAQRITALDVAEALNTLAAARGWPPVTFYGPPAPAPLN
ncbi:twin-arginine translocation signal domain-containing protein [Streptomyces scabiei]|uniref:twin-arginine translocation signal domain-containing protein n=1 Tax=Streptomyces scabiei TaxID=1930 RepID=UPI001B316A8C|nr:MULTISPECIES: twin-arginine translocation signal domain-containing protein [Streptomyces]MBP5865171.1 twin-arginine translocation signal domain-containing protein [Streptomyces sp. LBUM 1484]MBP5874144.1 twin-arginine translocation signal domain-containing protein [Streptomyces sp. LBUM 1477]MBP5881881.1 twin-arginine translocation signal domain-containing protein [Streptomyces sp. LBUM 1487]MBP5897651.1 twin-arginine translocation signal domain-containing protein [Streptomyces sp. LBUM 1488